MKQVAYLDSFLVFSTENDFLDVNGRNVDIFRQELSIFDNFFNFSDCNFGCFAHSWIEIARRFPIITIRLNNCFGLQIHNDNSKN